MQNEQSAKSTLIPRFSLKWLLGFTAVAAGVSFVLAQAVNQQAWALGVVIALQSLLLVFAVYAWFFAVAWLLGFTAVAAGVSFVLSQAVNRQAWALGVVIALESLLLVFAVYAWFFAVAWLFALLRRALAPPPRASSPFASAGPPAQLVPPRQPE